jgi:hypothetical protein
MDAATRFNAFPVSGCEFIRSSALANARAIEPTVEPAVE